MGGRCRNWLGVVALGMFLLASQVLCSKKGSKSLIEEINDQKDFKKLLRTKTNVLVVFHSSAIDVDLSKVLKEAAEMVKGIGTIVNVDCSDTNGKKLCKKMKIKPANYEIKHFKDGEFHKGTTALIEFPDLL